MAANSMIELSDQELVELSRFVEEKYGIVLIKKKMLIQGRLSHMLRERGITSFRDYMNILYKDTTNTEITSFLNNLNILTS